MYVKNECVKFAAGAGLEDGGVQVSSEPLSTFLVNGVKWEHSTDTR